MSSSIGLNKNSFLRIQKMVLVNEKPWCNVIALFIPKPDCPPELLLGLWSWILLWWWTQCNPCQHPVHLNQPNETCPKCQWLKMVHPMEIQRLPTSLEHMTSTIQDCYRAGFPRDLSKTVFRPEIFHWFALSSKIRQESPPSKCKRIGLYRIAILF